MGNKFVVRQPIRDAENKTIGYEILYYGENQAFTSDGGGKESEFSAADTVYHFLTENTDKVLRGSRSFMTFTTTLLMKKTPRLFDKSELVIQIDDSVIIHPLAMHMVQQYAGEGYQIAANEFRFAPRYLAQLEYFDYIKINFKNSNDASIRNTVEIAQSLGKQCIATEIDSEELRQKAIAMGVDALEGPYVAERMATRAHSSAYLRSNFFRLIVALTKPEPDVDEIEQLIALDASLTFALLKMSNSIYYALKHRATTIHQAVMTLGLNQLKQWVYLLSASEGEEAIDEASEEFLKRSFLRGNFCSELMRYAKDMPFDRSDAYLMGMFSTLDALIDAPLEEILSELPLPDVTKEALIHHTGRCGMLYDLVLGYERADWSGITRYAEELGIPSHLLTNVYFNCMETVNSIWTQLTSLAPQQTAEEETAPPPETNAIQADG